VRKNWVNLNGEWDFEIDFGQTGRAKKLYETKALKYKINVPFCPESKLSGVGYVDFMNAVWYKKTIDVSGEDLSGGKRTILHIGACDYKTEVWVNGKSVGTHIGGYIAFSFDITDYLTVGANVITICADDTTRSNQPGGKQSPNYYSGGCHYTRTTGIWQTVWTECVPASYIKSTKYTPDIHSSTLYIEADVKDAIGKSLTAEAFFSGKSVGKVTKQIYSDSVFIDLKLSELNLWSIETPNLYDLKLTLDNDSVDSYFGMREIVYSKNRFYLNGKSIFQRLILDQGFYPDGIYTAPTDDELKADVQRSMDMGFNGARLHQKIFEPRFLYHCDKMGYIVWGEHASWGLNLARPDTWENFIPEWLEALQRDYNHPAIVGWCPLNETNKEQNSYLLKMLYEITKAFDKTRPFIDASGYVHVSTDVVDWHDYDQNPETFKARYESKDKDPNLTFVSEYGGIGGNLTTWKRVGVTAAALVHPKNSSPVIKV
jgi:beta-galactosidase/beta-glucuronidase